jgi:hypothetical protein
VAFNLGSIVRFLTAHYFRLSVAFAVAVTGASAFAQEKTGFVFHSTVPSDQRRLLERDLLFLGKADFSLAGAAARKTQASVMGLPELTGR